MTTSVLRIAATTKKAAFTTSEIRKERITALMRRAYRQRPAGHAPLAGLPRKANVMLAFTIFGTSGIVAFLIHPVRHRQGMPMRTSPRIRRSRRRHGRPDGLHAPVTNAQNLGGVDGG